LISALNPPEQYTLPDNSALPAYIFLATLYKYEAAADGIVSCVIACSKHNVVIYV
jgi:hypothetical protein